MKSRKIFKFTILIVLIISMIMMFTGCGMAGADQSHKEDDYAGGSGSANKLCSVWKETISGVDTNGASSERNGIWGVPLKASTDYGSDIRGTKGLSIFRDIAITVYTSIFAGAPTGTDYFKGTSNFGSFNLQPGPLIQSVNTTTMGVVDGSAAMGGLRGVAAAILFTVWFMGFISQIINEKFTIETMLKGLMQLLCGLLLINNATALVKAFVAFGNSMVGSGGTPPGAMFASFKTAVNTILQTGIYSINVGLSIGEISWAQFGLGTVWIDWGSILALVIMAPPLIAQVVCAYKIVSILIMRMFELCARLSFAAIPLALGAQQGFSQESIRYFRGTLACAAIPALMMLGCSMFNSVASAVMSIFGGSTSSWFDGCLAMTITYFVLSAYFGETKRIVQDVFAR